MPFTDFEKKELFENRQTALNSSKIKAKKAFIESICKPEVGVDPENGTEYCYLKSTATYEKIAENFKLYEKLQNTIYTVVLKEVDYSIL